MISAGVGIAIAAVDSVIKQVQEQRGIEGQKEEILGGKLYLTKYHNKGVMLNLFDKHTDIVKGLSLGLCIICFFAYVLTLGKKGRKLLRLGLATLLGGAYSNTYDRMIRGYVVDYLGFNVPNEKMANIIFNISDFVIMIGALLCVIGI